MKEWAFAFLVAAVVRPALAEQAWVEIRPGGDTTCARGTPYSFFVFPGDSQKIVVDFIGGGACWNASTCSPESATFSDNVDDLRQQALDPQGVYRRNHPRNPYGTWTHVLVPYCTGDIHWGDQDVAYQRDNGTSFLIRHRGATNTRAVLSWLRQHHSTASDIVVQGCSAGSYGSILWTPHVAQLYPLARIVQYGDSGAGVMTPHFMHQVFGLWNVSMAAPAWIPALNPDRVDYTLLQLDDIYERIAGYYPNIHFAQYNHAEDFVQRLFLVRMGGNQLEWTSRMANSQRRISASTPNYRYFIAPTDEHCITTIDSLYETSSDGVFARDWLDDYIKGDMPPNVPCAQCGPLTR